MAIRLLFVLVGLLPPSLGAAILFDRSAGILRAPPFWYHPESTHENRLQGFDEAQGVRFTGTLRVQELLRWDNVVDLVDIRLEEAVLDSHMLFFNKANPGWVEVEAEVEFDAPILGFVADGFLFGGPQAMFAPEPTHTRPASRPNVWSLEEGAVADTVELLSPTRIRVRLRNSKAIDPLRVITLRSGRAEPPAPVLRRTP